MTDLTMQTGAWYNDRPLRLTFPSNWDVITHWPATPPPLADSEIAARIDDPIACPTIEDQAHGKSTVVIIVDDLSRPTPVSVVLPSLLERIWRAGVDPNAVSIVVATGTHGSQNEEALRNKLGLLAWERCRVEVHDDQSRTKYIGKTSYSTPILVNRRVLDAELLVGIGGVYPQHSTGFGGGGKLALGVCGRKTIMGLHYKHGSVGGRYDIQNDFRRDVCEIAERIHLRTIVTLHINAFSKVVNVMCGDHSVYYEEAARFSKEYYTAPVAHDADVVIANAYPLDTSLTFMRKGYKPLYTAPRTAVKIMLAAASEGVGVHGLYQHIDPDLLNRVRNRMLQLSSMGVDELARKLIRRARRSVSSPAKTPTTGKDTVTVLPPNAEHLYMLRTDPFGGELPTIESLTIRSDWGELLNAISSDGLPRHGPVRAHVYPCAPLQCLDDAQSPE